MALILDPRRDFITRKTTEFYQQTRTRYLEMYNWFWLLNGKPKTVSVTLGERPQTSQTPAATQTP